MTQPQDESQRNGRTAKRILAIGLPLVLVAGVGLGYANWTQSGAGTGAAKAMTAGASVVTGTATGPDLYPGQSAGKLYFHVSNPNQYQVTFSGATVGTITANPLPGKTCATTGVSVGPVGGLTVPPVTGADFALPIVSMSNLSDDGCQGASFLVALTLTGGTS
jgi:hypothetical protein